MARKKRKQSDDDALPVEGLWVSPTGEEIEVIEHLLAIKEKPERFGIPLAAVASADTLALREIGVELIRTGWIRFRYLSGVYAFEVDTLRKRYDKIESILIKARAYEAEDVTISQFIPFAEFNCTVLDVYERKVERFSQNPPRRANSWRLTKASDI
jgi:hypothetical protein